MQCRTCSYRGCWVDKIVITADYRFTGNLLTEGRLKGLAYDPNTGRYYLIPFADRFDDHDASVVCFELGFG